MASKEEIIARGTRAKRLLDDADLIQAFQDVRNAIHERFEEVSADDGESLIKLKQRLHVLDSVKANLFEAIQNGKIEAKALEEENVTWLGDLHGRFGRKSN